jgi:hypothetical protein
MPCILHCSLCLSAPKVCCVVHFVLAAAQEPSLPEPPTWYYYRLAGPQSVLQPLSTKTAAPSIAEAIHSSLKLPVDYNSSNIQLLQIGGPARHRHLLHHDGQAGSASAHLQEPRSSRAMLDDSSSSADKALPWQQRGARTTCSTVPIQLTWAFSFTASPALPEPAVLQARALSTDTSPNIIFFLGLQGVLDFDAATKVTGLMVAAKTSSPVADAPTPPGQQGGSGVLPRAVVRP